MKTAITYRCGHTQTETLYGGRYDAQRARKAQMLCPTCYHAAQAQQAAAATASLPALVGSEKQVGWATQLRATVMAWLAGEAAPPETHPPGPGAPWEAITGARAAETSAAWWIDQRAKTAQQIAAAAAKRAGVA